MSTLVDDDSRVYDVAIIGSGPSGVIAAQTFADAGMSVVCLEQGDFPDYGLVRNQTLEHDLVKGATFGSNPNLRRSAADYPIDDTESDVTPLMWNGVGGSSITYAAAWHRFKPSDFRVRTLDGVADDWPITYEELVPFYERVEQQFSVSGAPEDPAYPPGNEPPLPPFPLEDLERCVAAAHDRLGWHWWPGTNAIASMRTGNLEPCVRRGACEYGCFDGAKASVDRTHWPRARQLGVELRKNSRALRIETDAQGMATGVVYSEVSRPEERFLKAQIVVVAANGIGTPRLLLNSRSQAHPEGLANSTGLVGRRLMTHPFSVVVGQFKERVEAWQGPAGQRAYSLEFQETDATRGFLRGAKWQLAGTGAPASATDPFLWPKVEWGENFHQQVQERFAHSIRWGIIAEDLPDADNRIVLDELNVDSSGMPGVRIQYRTSENTRSLLSFNQEKAAESLREAGAYAVSISPSIKETGWHLLGTAVMGNDPSSSVVDGWGRSHDVSNLFIFDGSVMPTSSCVNPTGTVTALALRAAEAAVADRANQPVSTSLR